MQKYKEKWLINQLYDISDKTLSNNLAINPQEFAVLAAICKGAMNGDNKSKMGYARIVRLTGGLSRATIKRSIASMKKKNIITVHIGITSLGDKDDNDYEIHLDNLTKKNTTIVFSEEGNVPTMGGGGRVTQTLGGRVTQTPIKALSKNNYQEQELLNIVHEQNLTNQNNVFEISADSHFEDFWKAWPRKEKKIEARKVWIRNRLDGKAETIILDIRDRRARHDRWQDINYIPLPTTYLNQEGWMDDIIELTKHGDKQNGRTKAHQDNVTEHPTTRAGREYMEALHREERRNRESKY